MDNQIDVDSSDNELLEEVVGAPHGIAPLAMDPRLWLSMVNVKPPYLLDLEIESMKKFVLVEEIVSKVPQTTSALNVAIRARGTF